MQDFYPMPRCSPEGMLHDFTAFLRVGGGVCTTTD
jgi:hypothetical protein